MAQLQTARVALKILVRLILLLVGAKYLRKKDILAAIPKGDQRFILKVDKSPVDKEPTK